MGHFPVVSQKCEMSVSHLVNGGLVVSRKGSYKVYYFKESSFVQHHEYCREER